ncbi:MAG TPA: TOBE domain-containing protein, partial [Pirellulaceae bacterium]
QVSGGQRQRIALARALVRRPQLLLLDEPLAALDAPTREMLRPMLRNWLADSLVPVLLVAHDRLDTMALADQIIVMDHGRMLQTGSVTEVFNHPTNETAARIVGTETVREGRIVSCECGLATVIVGATALIAVAPSFTARDVYVCIRGEDVALRCGPDEQSSPRNQLRGIIRGAETAGPLVRVSLDCGFSLVALVTRGSYDLLGLGPNESVTAILKAPAIHLIPRNR